MRVIKASLWQHFAVGIAGAAISVLRLITTQPQLFGSMVWAEDGLLPLCVVKAGFLPCLIDSYAGYLLFLPRVVAGVVAIFPMEAWPLVTNLIATCLAGTACALAYALMLAQGRSQIGSVMIGLLPVAAPIVGFEVIGATASVNALILFVMALAIAFPPRGRMPVVAYSIGLLLAALTIPSAFALAIGIGVQAWRGRLNRRTSLIFTGSLVLGLGIQGLVIINADENRNAAVTFEALSTLVNSIPTALLTLWPGLGIGPTESLGFTLAPAAGSAWVLTAAIALGGIWLIFRRPRQWSTGLGLLLIMGLAIAALPVLTGMPNNRYFVVPVLLWAAAGIYAVDARVAGRRQLIVMGTMAVALVYLWSSSFSASPWRGNSSPRWPAELQGIDQVCALDPHARISMLFSPDWPTAETLVLEPTTAQVGCAQLGR